MLNDYTSIDIQVANKCNLKCKHCCMEVSMKENNDINFYKIHDFLKNNPQVDNVFLTGGEPLLDNLDSLELLINSFPNIYWMCSTNLCYDLNLQRLRILNKINSVATSFDIGIRFGNIKNLVKWYNNCKFIIDNNIINSGLEVYITLTKDVCNIDPKRFKDVFTKIGFTRYKYRPLAKAGPAYSDENYRKILYPTKDEFNNFIDKVLDLDDKTHNIFPWMILNKYVYSCNYTKIQPLDPNGNKQECIFYEKYNCKCKIDPECYTCKDFRYCGGRCPLRDCMFDKNIYDKTKERYKDYKIQIKEEV